MREFKCYNPYMILAHFIFVISVCMLVMHPVILCIAFISGAVYSVLLLGYAKSFRVLAVMLPLIVITAVLNPLFNHSGATVIWYFPSGNPLTKEAIVYGACSGVMLGAVIMWFSCFNQVFKSDKILYVFGKIAPSLSLVLSMALRFIPEFIRRTGELIKAQRVNGRDIEKGSIAKRAKLATEVLSAMTGWSLENSIETAQSMKARGFRGAKRTAFSVYSFNRQDAVFTWVIALCALGFVSMFGNLEYAYYPAFSFSVDFIGLSAYTVVCFAPIMIDITEGRRWR